MNYPRWIIWLTYNTIKDDITWSENPLDRPTHVCGRRIPWDRVRTMTDSEAVQFVSDAVKWAHANVNVSELELPWLSLSVNFLTINYN